jgi:DNA topoisomerase-3
VRQLNAIKAKTSGIDALMIATDVDPSGEGELLAYEIIDFIGWTGDVYRMYFTDESEKVVQRAFKNRQLLDRDKNKNGDYVKAETRNRWDYVSMQLTRISTTLATRNGFAQPGKQVLRNGRLKSVMVRLAYDQLLAIKNYVRKPYYESKFKDENGHVFSRTVPKDMDPIPFRFNEKIVGLQDLAQYKDSPISEPNIERKKQAPASLIDLSTLSSLLGKKGFSSQLVLDVYQTLYDNQVVSYPRTEDKIISSEQFNELLPLVDEIAEVVSVDNQILTHRVPRKTHVKEGGVHGANRPGTNVPNSLDALEKYFTKSNKGFSVSQQFDAAKAIYETLAKNFLAMFAEDYVYDNVRAALLYYPDFATNFNIPVAMNWKAIFDSEKQLADEDNKEENTTTGLGDKASPFLYEGANTKPPKPTQTWLMKRLEVLDVGTGATRVSTYSDISTGSQAQLKDARGVITLTQIGETNAILLENTHIANPEMTKRLFDNMDKVGKFDPSMTPAKIANSIDVIVRHDLRAMQENVQLLQPHFGKVLYEKQKEKERVTLNWNDQTISIGATYATHRFTQEELERLSHNQVIEINGKTKEGKPIRLRGKIEEKKYRGKLYPVFAGQVLRDGHTVIWNGQNVLLPKTWAGYTFSQDDVSTLASGGSIEIIGAKSAKGNIFNAKGKIDQYVDKENVKRIGFVPIFEKRAFNPNTHAKGLFKGKEVTFKRDWSNHHFTDSEVTELLAGKGIEIQATSNKTGKPFKVKGRLKDDKKYGFGFVSTGFIK